MDPLKTSKTENHTRLRKKNVDDYYKRYNKDGTVLLKGNPVTFCQRPLTSDADRSIKEIELETTNQPDTSLISDLIMGVPIGRDPLTTFFNDINGWDENQTDMLDTSIQNNKFYKYLRLEENNLALALPFEETEKKKKKKVIIKPKEEKEVSRSDASSPVYQPPIEQPVDDGQKLLLIKSLEFNEQPIKKVEYEVQKKIYSTKKHIYEQFKKTVQSDFKDRGKLCLSASSLPSRLIGASKVMQPLDPVKGEKLKTQNERAKTATVPRTKNSLPEIHTCRQKSAKRHSLGNLAIVKGYQFYPSAAKIEVKPVKPTENILKLPIQVSRRGPKMLSAIGFKSVRIVADINSTQNDPITLEVSNTLRKPEKEKREFIGLDGEQVLENGAEKRLFPRNFRNFVKSKVV